MCVLGGVSSSDCSSRELNNVNGSELGLFAAGHKHNSWFLSRSSVFLNRLKDGLGHCHESRGVVGHVEALDVQLEVERTNLRVEIERVVGRAVEPLSEIACVCDRGGESDDANVALDLLRDVAHATADDLVDRAVVAAQQMQLVDDEQLDVLNLFFFKYK